MQPSTEVGGQKKETLTKSTLIPIKENALEMKEEAVAIASNNLPEALTSHFSELRLGGPKLPIYVDISQELWTEELNSRYESPKPLSILNSELEHGALLSELRSGGTIHGIKRGTAVGYMSLVTGWLMDDENKQDIYVLFSNRMAESEISTGDVMLAIIIRETAKMGNPGVELSELQLQEWSKLARAKNSLVRQISAFTFPNLTCSLEDQSKFFLEFGNEPEFEIIKTLARNIQRMPKSQGDVLIGNLSILQQKSGNLQGSSYLQSLLSAAK